MEKQYTYISVEEFEKRVAEKHLCGRSACQEEGAAHFNKETKKFYCTPCARKLNEFPLSDGTVLCDWPKID